MINNYVYWIENRDTNMSYVGVRSCDIEPIDDIGVKYFTSSQDKNFRQDFKANPEKYNIDIINNFIERQEAMNLEIQIHNWNNVDANDKFYNKAKQTSSGFGITGMTGNKHPNYGKHHSEEARAKMSENHRDNSGKNNPMFGKKHSAETLKKMSIAFKGEKHPNYGKHPSKETLKKMSIANLGKKLTQEHKDKLSKAHKGKISPMRGKKHTKEARKKMSENHWDSSGKNNPMFGKKHSAETLKKMSEAFKGEKHPMYGKKQPTAECIHCGLEGIQSNINRWHNNNCKHRA